MDWKIFLRQLFLCSGPCSLYFLLGMRVGFSTVLLPQLSKDNQNITIEDFSWLPALHAYSGIPWVIVLSILAVIIGRKKSYIIVCICTFIGFIFLYFSTNMNHFFIAEIFSGALTSSHLTLNVIILTECISPKYRGIFLTLKSATFFWGVLVANAIGTFFHWRNIIILGLICSIYTLLNVIIWPESPLWLATKGKIVECAASHRWLKGADQDSERELKNLLKAYENVKFLKTQWGMRYFYRTICRKQFFKPILLANLLVCIYCFSGKLVFTVYALDILKKITSSESAAYSGMLILDGVTVASMYLGCLLSSFLRRRLIFISFTITAIVIMIFISVYLYLAKLSVIEEHKYVSIFLLAAYSITVSCGPMIMSTTIIGELIPLGSRITSMCMIALSFKLANGTFLKLSPLCFKYLAMHGTFALYAVLSMIFLILIYFYVPETKDKTLQQIEECLNGEQKTSIEENAELMLADKIT